MKPNGLNLWPARMTNELIPHNNFNHVAEMAQSAVSASSARVYAQTYRLWLEWCLDEDRNPFMLTFQDVRDYLDDLDVTKRTKQRQLSALRKLAEILHIFDLTNLDYERNLKSLKLLKARSGGGTERSKKALTPAEVDKVLRVWDGDDLRNLRNNAIIASLFFVGLRREELSESQWQHIDLDRATWFIPHGKGDKERSSAIMGDFALEALAAWHAETDGRVFAFPSLTPNARELGADQPSDNQAMMIYRVVKQSAKLSGVDFKPHDARRTFITESLSRGMPLHEVQDQVGHADGSTTLIYAGAVGAEARAKNTSWRLRYG